MALNVASGYWLEREQSASYHLSQLPHPSPPQPPQLQGQRYFSTIILVHVVADPAWSAIHLQLFSDHMYRDERPVREVINSSLPGLAWCRIFNKRRPPHGLHWSMWLLAAVGLVTDTVPRRINRKPHLWCVWGEEVKKKKRSVLSRGTCRYIDGDFAMGLGYWPVMDSLWGTFHWCSWMVFVL